MSKNCEIVKDLLPLYADEVCSEESKKLVAAHIAECAECKAELDKMGMSISLNADADINVMKRIKKRMRIEKIAVAIIAAIGLISVMGILSFVLINTQTPMTKSHLNIGEDIKAEVDENGDLWLVMKNYAATEDMILPTISDANGKHLGIDKDFDASIKKGFGVTLMHRMIDSFGTIDTFHTGERRAAIININEVEVDQFFYYDQKENKEYLLWERD